MDVKNEFLANYSTVSFCHACLSTDRALSTAKEYFDVFFKLFDNQKNMVQPDTLLCWECLALMKKVGTFTRRVTEAQRMMQFYYLNRQDPLPASLSTLSTSQMNTNVTTITYEEKEFKPVKLENEFEDQFETFENFDFVTDDIKDEPELAKLDEILESKIDIDTNTDAQCYVKTKEFNDKRNLKRAAKYRFVNTKIKKHRDLLVRKIPISVNELLSSLEEERCNVSFVNAEHKCVSCVEVFDDAEKVAKHNKKYHDESLGPYTCLVCQSRWVSASALGAHLSRHARRECRACGLRACARAALRRHVAVHHRMVQCLACGLFFNNVRLFYNHYKAMHSRFVCDVCGKRCKTRQIIEKHLRYHFGYECPYCKKKLKNSSSYNNHVECQHGAACADAAYCVPCDRRFKNDKLYKRHLQASAAHARERDNTRTKRKYPCPECSNVYSRRTYMNNHYRHVHSKQSKHYCEDCDRHFLNRTRFVDHRRYKHEGAQRDKDKLCNICGRGFAANRTLVNHLRTHSGERPFACEHCGAKFTQKHAMLSHVQYIHLKSKRKPSWRD